MKKISLALFFLFFLFNNLFAQTDEKVEKLMNQAKAQMAAGKYEAANSTFRKILASKSVLPTDLSYLFAETLYMIGQYKNSESFLNKYFNLTGTTGDYYTEGLELKKQLANKFEEIRQCKLCDDNGYRHIKCDFCQGVGHKIGNCHNCKGKGKIICPGCHGDGLIYSYDAFGKKKIQECSKCMNKGVITCDICNGKIMVETKCEICKGTGSKSSNQICSHK